MRERCTKDSNKEFLLLNLLRKKEKRCSRLRELLTDGRQMSGGKTTSD